MSSHVQPKRGAKRAADEVLVDDAAPIDISAPSHWVRRSIRPQKAVKYYENSEDDFVEDVSESAAVSSALKTSETYKMPNVKTELTAVISSPTNSINDHSPSVTSAYSTSSSEQTEQEDVAPSASNKYKFTSGSPSGRTAAQLDSLFRPPPRMPLWKMDIDGRQAIRLSFTQLGPRPKQGLADELVKQMEKQHALDIEEAENAMTDIDDEDEKDL